MTFSVRASSDQCLVPIRSGALYRSIRAMLTADVDASPAQASPIEARLVGGTHPFVDVSVTAMVHGRMSTRTLSIPRHTEGTLELGFFEGDASGDLWMRGYAG